MEDSTKKLTETALFFKVAQEKKKELKAELETVQANLDMLEEDLYNQLEYAELQSIKTEDGTFFRKQRLMCSCPPENKTVFYRYLKNIGNGSIIYETINHNNLASWAKEQIKEGAEVPVYLHVNTKHQIGFRKA